MKTIGFIGFALFVLLQGCALKERHEFWKQVADQCDERGECNTGKRP